VVKNKKISQTEPNLKKNTSTLGEFRISESRFLPYPYLPSNRPTNTVVITRVEVRSKSTQFKRKNSFEKDMKRRKIESFPKNMEMMKFCTFTFLFLSLSVVDEFALRSW